MRDESEKRPIRPASGRKNGKGHALPQKELLRRLGWYRARRRALDHVTAPPASGALPLEDESRR